MPRIHLLSAAAGLALLGATPLVAQASPAPAAPPVTPPATAVPVPTTSAPATVGPEAREAVVEPEVEAKADAKAKATVNSQGAANSSVNGLANASTNSALAGAGKPELNAITGGTAVIGTGGTSIGSVTGLVKNRAGATVGLQVKLADGSTATIPASELTLSGSTLTTTWVAKK